MPPPGAARPTVPARGRSARVPRVEGARGQRGVSRGPVCSRTARPTNGRLRSESEECSDAHGERGLLPHHGATLAPRKTPSLPVASTALRAPPQAPCTPPPARESGPPPVAGKQPSSTVSALPAVLRTWPRPRCRDRAVHGARSAVCPAPGEKSAAASIGLRAAVVRDSDSALHSWHRSRKSTKNI